MEKSMARLPAALATALFGEIVPMVMQSAVLATLKAMRIDAKVHLWSELRPMAS